MGRTKRDVQEKALKTITESRKHFYAYYDEYVDTSFIEAGSVVITLRCVIYNHTYLNYQKHYSSFWLRYSCVNIKTYFITH